MFMMILFFYNRFCEMIKVIFFLFIEYVFCISFKIKLEK